jgi:hypothetical protein
LTVGRVALERVGVAETAAAVLADRVGACRFDPAFEFAIGDVSVDLGYRTKLA